MTLLRRLLPRRQAATCKGCGRLLSERRRRPCPFCGSLARLVAVGWQEGPAASSDFR